MPDIEQRFNGDTIGHESWTQAEYDTEQIIERKTQKKGVVRVDGIVRGFWGIDIVSEPGLTDLYCLRHLPSGLAIHTGHANNGYTIDFMKDLAAALEGPVTLDQYDIPEVMRVLKPLIDGDHRQAVDRIRFG